MIIWIARSWLLQEPGREPALRAGRLLAAAAAGAAHAVSTYPRARTRLSFCLPNSHSARPACGTKAWHSFTRSGGHFSEGRARRIGCPACVVRYATLGRLSATCWAEICSWRTRRVHSHVCGWRVRVRVPEADTPAVKRTLLSVSLPSAHASELLPRVDTRYVLTYININIGT